ncbi:MAG: hypothetical protein OZ948_04635 [Deltaproteobacteria bacterium]|nr:hypothetical protein [Deltaproteobacteria bacterium]
MVQAILFLAYPFAIYLALGHASPRAVALGALALLALRTVLTSPHRGLAYARAGALPVAAVGVALVTTAIWNDPIALLFAPALGSFALFVAFAGSLLRVESVVEAIARVSLGSLDVEQSRYCRRVTLVWAAFFLVNGATSAFLALYGTVEAWTLYTGLVAYLLIGLLFAAEYSYRQWRFRIYLGAPTDPLFQRLFPPRAD